jgi:hypothetical protein
MKRIIFLLTLVFIFTGCNNKNQFAVNGVIKDSKTKYIYLNKLEDRKSVV